MESNLPDRLITAEEAGVYLGYSEGTVRNKASAGEIPFTKLPSGALRFRISALDAWIAAHNEPKPAAAEGVAL